MKWPNKLARLPEEFGDYIVIPDGFLVPVKGKRNGNLLLADKNGKLHRITEDEKNVFYHEVEFFDFNGDGLKDILTSRVRIVGRFPWNQKWTGDLIWYENPGKARITELWPKHYITEGPDVIFRKVKYGSGYAIFTTEFFAEVKKLSVQFVTKDGVLTGSRVIDANMGKPFGIELADLDGDGVDELLFTNHQDQEDAIKAAVYAYEIPADLQNGDFTRHTLAQGISELKVDTSGAGSPGFPIPFYPKVSETCGPMHIMVAGDGSYDVWYLRPKVGGKRFEYESTLLDIGGTTGEMLLHDFNGDGINDILIPDNDFWKLHVITFDRL